MMYAAFKDRVDAGKQLAQALSKYKSEDLIVLAVPRGGVPVGFEVAKSLGAPLDLVVPRKIGAPDNPELAVGAVAEDGTVILNTDLVESLGISGDYIRDEAERQRGEIERRIKEYRGDRPLPDLRGKTVIIVDDGIATGATTAAAIESVRRRGAKQVVLAVPVAPPDVVTGLKEKADEVIALYTPRQFYAVGVHYKDFTQTSDKEVKTILQQAQS